MDRLGNNRGGNNTICCLIAFFFVTQKIESGIKGCLGAGYSEGRKRVTELFPQSRKLKICVVSGV